MKKQILFLFAFIIACQCAVAEIIYVNDNATGANNGNSWASAYTDLQDAIGDAVTGDEIWVAAGTYKPIYTANPFPSDRQISFRPPTGVAMYGGFAGNETQLDQRDWTIHLSILDGNIGNQSSPSDNSERVVYANSSVTNARFDGFKVINGYNQSNSGGGMLANGSMVIENCTFTANYSAGNGTGLSVGGGLVDVINCNISNNVGRGGSGLQCSATRTNIIGCTISENDGISAIYIIRGECYMDRCIVSGNISNGDGYVAATVLVSVNGNESGTANIYNSLFTGNISDNTSVFHVYTDNENDHIFWNNTVAGNKSTASEDVYSCALNGSQQTSFRNCIIWDNDGNRQIYWSTGESVQYCIVDGGYGGTGNTSTDPLFVNPGSGSQAPFNASGFDYTLQTNSTAINTGSNISTSNFYDLDLLDSARISGLTVDRGCYEKQFCNASITITSSGPTSFCSGSFVTLTASSGDSYTWSNGANSQSIAASTSGTYTVNVVDANGCFGTASQVVTVYPASVTISGSHTICEGESTMLTASSPNGSIFNWSTGATGPTITVTEEDTYTVTVTTINSCTATSAAFNVTVNTVNTPVITLNFDELTSTAADDYQWYLNGDPISGATDQTYTFTQNGNYSVVVTDNGCESEESNTINVTTASIEDEENILFNIYPNPVSTTLIIETQILEGAYQLQDITGKVLLSGLASGETKFSLDISALSKGIYLLSLIDGEQQVNRKVVKE